jgi:non-specific serine/threonine protein kinase/serine/threonine-protein kinase
MREHTLDTPPENSREDDTWVRVAFHTAYFADCEAGREESVEHYATMFPGHEETVTTEYAFARGDSETPAPEGSASAGRHNMPSLVGPYRVLRPLGRGGQANVYLAEDTRLARQVALKILRRTDRVLSGTDSDVQPSAVFRLMREAMLTARLNDPGICPVYDAGSVDGHVFVAMGYVPGRTLGSLIAAATRDHAEPPLSVPVRQDGGSAWRPIAGLVEQAARSLHMAHEAGIVHRDIKPGNLMVTTDGRPVILDFGLAREGGDDGTLPSVTRTDALPFGTPGYMSPEQVRGGGELVGRATDIWALGVVLYECLALRRPFSAPGARALQDAILVGEPDLGAPGVPDVLRPVLACCLAKDPARRYLSAADLADDLQQVLDGNLTSAPMPGVVYRVRSFVRRRPTFSAVACLLLVAVVVAGVWSNRVVERERQLRAESEQAFGELNDLVEGLVFDIHGSLKTLPGATRAKKLLLDKAVRYMAILERRQDDKLDANFAVSLMATYIKLGDVLGHPHRQNLGDPKAAEASYERALAVVAKVAPGEAGTLDRRVRHQVINAEGRLADMLFASGRRQQAWQKQLGILERLAAEDPNDDEVFKLTLTTHGNLSLSCDAIGDAEGARRHMEEAVAMSRHWPERYQGSRLARCRLAGALVNLGVFLERHHEPAQAFELHTEAQQILLELVNEQPNDFEVINQLSAARTCLSRLHAQRGEATEARRLVKQSLAHQNWMLGTARSDPTVLRRLCMTYASALDTLGVISDEGDYSADAELSQYVAHLHMCMAALASSHSPTVMNQEIVLKTGLWLAQWYLEHDRQQEIDKMWPDLRAQAQKARSQRVLRHWRTLDGFVQLGNDRLKAARTSFRVAVAAMAKEPRPRPWLHLQALLGLGLAELPDSPKAARAAFEAASKLKAPLTPAATRSWPRCRMYFLGQQSRSLAAELRSARKKSDR